MSNFELWSERGVTYVEIVARIQERDEKECLAAREWIGPAFPKSLWLRIAEMADTARSTSIIMEVLETAGLLNPDPAIPADILEIMALTVEGYVRAAEKCFPQGGRN